MNNLPITSYEEKTQNCANCEENISDIIPITIRKTVTEKRLLSTVECLGDFHWDRYDGNTHIRYS